MNHIYQHRRHNKNLLMVHLIFAAKYRKALLFGTFRTDVKRTSLVYQAYGDR